MSDPKTALTEEPIILPLPISVSDLAYAAGYFEADGHLSVGKRKARNRKHPEWYIAVPAAGVTSAHYGILYWFQARWGGFIGRDQMTASPSLHMGSAGQLFSSAHRQWQVNYRTLIPFLRDVMPYLKLRAVIAQNVLRCAELTASRAHAQPWDQDYFEKQAAFYLRHTKLMAALRGQRGREVKHGA